MSWRPTRTWCIGAALAALVSLGASWSARAQAEVDETDPAGAAVAAPAEAPAEGAAATNDAAAREYFLLGRAAYRVADYETALGHFQGAYQLSGRSRLQYNIGISADRLGRTEDALEAFERYLEGTENPAREEEVRMRVAVLRLAVEENKRRELALIQATAANSIPAIVEDADYRRVPQSAIIGGSILAALGVVGVVTMGVGFSQNGTCLETDASGVCVAERNASPWTPVYGALGIAALAGSATWLVVGSRRASAERNTSWNLTPTGVLISGSF